MKEQTCVGLVEEVLRKQDDFLTGCMLQQMTGLASNQISAALCSLRKYGVIDVVIQADGIGWWYALPPLYDQRQLTYKSVTFALRNRKTGIAHKRGKTLNKFK